MTALPTPEPIALPLNSWRVVVAEHSDRYGRNWQAEVEIDGEIWTIACSHLHHSHAAAAKCVRKVERRFANLLDEYRPSLLQREPYRLVEWKKVEYREGGSALVWSQRMTPSTGVEATA